MFMSISILRMVPQKSCERCVLAIEGQEFEGLLPSVIVAEQLLLPIPSQSVPAYCRSTRHLRQSVRAFLSSGPRHLVWAKNHLVSQYGALKYSYLKKVWHLPVLLPDECFTSC